MKNGRTQAPQNFFTAREVHELLEKAKALGVVRLELKDGLRFEFSPGTGATEASPPRSRATMAPPDRTDVGPDCEDCGEPQVRSNKGGFYCKPCWQVWKDSQKN